jgi:hypothetical protein
VVERVDHGVVLPVVDHRDSGTRALEGGEGEVTVLRRPLMAGNRPRAADRDDLVGERVRVDDRRLSRRAAQADRQQLLVRGAAARRWIDASSGCVNWISSPWSSITAAATAARGRGWSAP